MQEMLMIMWEILFPIFAVIIAGYLMQKKFKLNLESLTKIQLYLFIPALIFLNIATSVLESDLVFKLVSFTLVSFGLLMILSLLIARLLKLERKKEKAFVNAVVLRNQGNFGIPLISLLYATTGNAYPLSVHMIVLFTTNLLLNTVGIYNASSGTYTKREAIVKVLSLPMIYVVILGFLFKGTGLILPKPIYESLDIMSNGVVPLALFTLGAQLANSRLRLVDKTLPIAAISRLIISPLMAYGLTLLFGITGEMAQVLILGAAAPTAINSVLLAIEFNGDAEYASETVFLSTLLSIITVTGIIALIR